MPIVSTPAPRVGLACPDCRGAVDAESLQCAACGRDFPTSNGVPELLPKDLLGLADTEQRQHALYAAVAHEYDDVFPRHVAEHYIDKRTGLVKSLLPMGGLVLDVGCGTGQLGAAIASEGFDVFGVDLSPSMVAKARERGLAGTFAGVTTALPFADNSLRPRADGRHAAPPRDARARRGHGRRDGPRGQAGRLRRAVGPQSGQPVLADPDEARAAGLGRRAAGAAGRAAARHARLGPAALTGSCAAASPPTSCRVRWRSPGSGSSGRSKSRQGLNVLAAHNVVVARKP